MGTLLAFIAILWIIAHELLPLITDRLFDHSRLAPAFESRCHSANRPASDSDFLLSLRLDLGCGRFGGLSGSLLPHVA